MAKAKTKSRTQTKVKKPTSKSAPATKRTSRTSRTKASKKAKTLGQRVSQFVGNAKSAIGLGAEQDLISLILEDHKRLKELIKIMKDSDADLSKRKKAFSEFAIALVAHSKPEEKTLYTQMKEDEEMREDGFEGDVEHGVAYQLIKDIESTTEKDLLGARIKVLAEVVEHHIEEEESSMLPEYRNSTDEEQRVRQGERFLKLKTEVMASGATN